MAEEPQNLNQGDNPDDQEGGQNPEDETEQSVEELKSQIKELKTQWDGEKVGMVEQIKELRGKLHEAQFVKPDDKKPEPSPKGEDEVEQKVLSILTKEKEEKRETNRRVAYQKFVEKHPEFNPANDIAGLRNEILMSSYKRLNTQNSVSEEEILNDLETAYLIVSKDSDKGRSKLNEFATTPTSGGKPKATEELKLTAEQEKLRKEKGWTIEKYLKMKSKYPKIIL